MHVVVEVSAFDNDVRFPFNHSAILKIWCALRRGIIAHFFDCFIAVNCAVANYVPLDSIGYVFEGRDGVAHGEGFAGCYDFCVHGFSV